MFISKIRSMNPRKGLIDQQNVTYVRGDWHLLKHLADAHYQECASLQVTSSQSIQHQDKKLRHVSTTCLYGLIPKLSSSLDSLGGEPHAFDSWP